MKKLELKYIFLAALLSTACSTLPPYKATTQVRLPIIYTCWLAKAECHVAYEAARRLNQAVGYSALVESQSKRYEEASGLVLERGIGLSDPLAGTRVVAEYDALTHRIYLRIGEGLIGDSQLQAVFMHEFLHSIGYSHVTAGLSIMNPGLEGEALRHRGLTPFDVRSLRAMGDALNAIR